MDVLMDKKIYGYANQVIMQEGKEYFVLIKNQKYIQYSVKKHHAQK